MTNKYSNLNTVAAFMNFSEFAWEAIDMMFEEKPDDKDVNQAVFLALEEVGIKVDDQAELLKILPYYYTEGYDDLDGQEGFQLEAPDFDTIFEKVGIN